MIARWKWMEGQMLTRRWFWCDRTLAQSPVSSFDQGEFVWCDRTLRGERPDAGCQRSVDSSKVPERQNHDRTCPVTTLTLEVGVNWPEHPVNMIEAFGHPVDAHNGLFFDQGYKYFLHSCEGVLLLIPIAEKHLWECQEEQGPSEEIEIWESQREPSLVRSRVAKCASTLLIRLVMVKWEFVLVTLGDHHHLDGSVVIGSLVIIRWSLWITQLKLWAIVGDSPRRSVEESAHREHLILARIKGSYTLTRVLQRGLVESGDSRIPR